MSSITDVFVAAGGVPEQRFSVEWQPGVDGGAGIEVVVDGARGIAGGYPIARLGEAICGIEHDLELLAEASPDGPWLLVFPPALVEAFATMDAGGRQRAGARWLEDYAGPGTSPEVLEEVLSFLVDGIQRGAARARDRGERLYVWDCL